MAAPGPDCRSGCSGGIKRRRDGDIDSTNGPSGPEVAALNGASVRSFFDALHMLEDAHGHGSGFLGFLSTIDAVPVRAACKELRDAVADFPWDSSFRVIGSLRLWFACFPCALAINVSNRKDLGDTDFVYLQGISRLDMSGCS